jgi:hypothetical protein
MLLNDADGLSVSKQKPQAPGNSLVRLKQGQGSAIWPLAFATAGALRWLRPDGLCLIGYTRCCGTMPLS